jgi:hypothetical protein
LPALRLAPGQPVGQFSFGSSIVLLFEAPAGLTFPVEPMASVRYGQHLL